MRCLQPMGMRFPLAWRIETVKPMRSALTSFKDLVKAHADLQKHNASLSA